MTEYTFKSQPKKPVLGTFYLGTNRINIGLAHITKRCNEAINDPIWVYRDTEALEEMIIAHVEEVLAHEHIHKILKEDSIACRKFDNVAVCLNPTIPIKALRDIVHNQQECDEANVRCDRVNMTNSSFTTAPPYYIERGNKTIRKRCLEFADTLRIKQIKELPVETAKELFSLHIIDLWDRTTLKSYFGVQAHRTTIKMHRRKQYISGTVSIANIELSRDITERKGYLEKLGLIHYEKRGNTVFLVLENHTITPELKKVSAQSNDNLSLILKPSPDSLREHPIARTNCLMLPEGHVSRGGVKGGGRKRERVL